MSPPITQRADPTETGNDLPIDGTTRRVEPVRASADLTTAGGVE